MRFVPVREQKFLPTKKTKKSVCYDLYLNTSKANVEEFGDIFIPFDQWGNYIILPTGLMFQADEDEDVYLRIYARSSTYKNYRFILANGVGIVDTDYRHEIGVLALFPDRKVRLDENGVYDYSEGCYLVKNGDRIAQVEVLPKIHYASIDGVIYEDNERNGGFGSTGKG